MQMLKFAGILALAGGAMASSAAATPVVTVCGALESSRVKTEIVFFSSASEQPVIITGTGTVIDVPAGTSRCIRVRFSAVANCPFACFLRATENTIELNPKWVANPLRFSQDATNGGTAHAFEWAARIGPGQHTIRILMQTGNTIANADIGPWTLSIDMMK